MIRCPLIDSAFPGINPLSTHSPPSASRSQFFQHLDLLLTFEILHPPLGANEVEATLSSRGLAVDVSASPVLLPNEDQLSCPSCLYTQTGTTESQTIAVITLHYRHAIGRLVLLDSNDANHDGNFGRF